MPKNDHCQKHNMTEAMTNSEALTEYNQLQDELVELMRSADPDLIQLGIPHCCDISPERPDTGFLGVIFHCNEETEATVGISIDGNTLSTRPFKYFNIMVPWHHTYLVPQDHTLGCYYIDGALRDWKLSVTVNDVCVDSQLKYIIPRENPVHIHSPAHLCRAWLAGVRSNLLHHSVPPSSFSNPVLVTTEMKYTECEPFHCDICTKDEEQTIKAVLSCTHLVCKGCATIWFKMHNTCPFCRAVQFNKEHDP